MSARETGDGGRTALGPLVFLATLVATLAFFWWFLVYDHAPPPPVRGEVETNGGTP